MDQISDKVYLGNLYSAKDEEELIKNNIRRVLSCNCYCDIEYKDKSIQHKILELNDSPNTNIIKYFK